MKIDELSKQDQIYYYYGLIPFLADELGLYDEYDAWLETHRSLDELKKQAQYLKDKIEYEKMHNPITGKQIDEMGEHYGEK